LSLIKRAVDSLFFPGLKNKNLIAIILQLFRSFSFDDLLKTTGEIDENVGRISQGIQVVIAGFKVDGCGG
jgi:hypothetical protein